MPRRIATLAVLVLFVCVTLSAPFRAAFVLCGGQTDAAPQAASQFISVTPQTAHAALCSCATCPGLRVGGKCCCTGATTPGEGYALRAMCDTAPDASAPVSQVPPAPLVRAFTARLPRFSLALRVGYATAPRRSFAPRSPLPPDAPPRSIS